MESRGGGGGRGRGLEEGEGKGSRREGGWSGVVRWGKEW